ncbi:cytochrome P450 [Streptomyces sp. NPDC058457]|uniref:cytochrome P450 n=1 Tax=Streptomyces sp. NPDC058457 TaxID=3346507 RepID=UPI0036537B8C
MSQSADVFQDSDPESFSGNFYELHHREGFAPPPELMRYSEQAPVLADTSELKQDWIVTGREEVRAVLGDAERFSTLPPAESAEDSRRVVQIGNPLMHDPPEHTRLRKMLTPEFTVRRMRRMEPLIERIVADRLDVMERAGRPVDLMRHFAWPIPGLVGGALLGVPRDDQAELARTLDVSRRTEGNWKARRTAANAFDGYMARFVQQKRRVQADDMLSMLIREHGADATDKELVGICASIIAAGLENMAGMLGMGVLALLRHPEQLAALRERPELMDHAVEELLRYTSVVPVASPRTALEDVPLGDEVIKEGQVVSCSFMTVNFGPTPGEEDREGLDITREDTSHMAFGHGIHYCVAAALARLELRIAFTLLLERFPGLRLGVPEDGLRYRPTRLGTWSVEVLPVTW